jgi:hypothetical protein
MPPRNISKRTLPDTKGRDPIMGIRADRHYLLSSMCSLSLDPFRGKRKV